MTTILLKCINRLEHAPKTAVLNTFRNSKFPIYRHVKPLNTSVSSEPQLNDGYMTHNTLMDEMLYGTVDKKKYIPIVSIEQKCEEIIRNSKNNNLRKDELIDLVDHLSAPYYVNSKFTNVLLESCNYVKDCSSSEIIELFDSIWEILVMIRTHFTTQQYNIRLKLYIDHNHDFSPFNIYMEMVNRNIMFNFYTYNLFIQCYCMKENIDEHDIQFWNNFLNGMHHLKLESESREMLHNALMKKYVKMGNVDSALKIIFNRRKAKTVITSELYTGLMCVHAKVKNLIEIDDILTQCRKAYIFFTNVNILEVIYTLAQTECGTPYVKMMYVHLKKVVSPSAKEMQYIYYFIGTNQIQLAMDLILHMTFLTEQKPGWENAMTLIIQYTLDSNERFAKVIEICNYFKFDKELYKEVLTLSLRCSFLKDDSLSFTLLRMYKDLCTIKPHFFWPFLHKRKVKCHFPDVLDLLNIMTNEFNVSPCVDTIVDYVLPLCYGSPDDIRDLLLNYGIDTTLVDNAQVLAMLKQFSIVDAARYITTFRNKYLYDILAHDLRTAAVRKGDVMYFLYISRHLVGKNDELEGMSIDEHLYEVMIDFPRKKPWLRKVINVLPKQGIRLQEATMKAIDNFLKE